MLMFRGRERYSRRKSGINALDPGHLATARIGVKTEVDTSSDTVANNARDCFEAFEVSEARSINSVLVLLMSTLSLN